MMMLFAGRYRITNSFLLLALQLLPLALAQSAPAGNVFVNPPAAGEWFDYSENHNYLIGDVIDLQWQTKFERTTLALFQQNNSTATPLLSTPQISTSYQWTVNVDDFDLENGNIFFLWVYDGKLFDYDGYSFTSHYFNILTDGDKAPSSAQASVSAAPVTTPPPTSILTVLPKTTSVETPTSEPTSTVQKIAHSTTTQPAPAAQSTFHTSPHTSSPTAQSSGGTDTTKIAIGVGVGVGVSCLLIGAVAGLSLRRRSSRRENSKAAYFAASEKSQDSSPGWRVSMGYGHQPRMGELDDANRYGGFHELDAKGKTYELGT